MWTRAFTIIVAVLAVAAGVAIAQQSSAPGTKPGASQAPAEVPPPASAKAAPAVPHPDQQLILIRSTLLAVNQANLTGNYTVVRDLATPEFQQGNSAARLTDIFRKLRSEKIDLGAVAVLMPKLRREPSISKNGRLHLSGFFPSQPEQVNFSLSFQMIGGRWRLYGIALNTKPIEPPGVATGATAQPATPPPGADNKSEPTNEPVAATKDSAVTPPTPPDKTTKKALPAPTNPAAAATVLPDPRAKVEQLETNPAPQTKPKPKPEQSYNPFAPF